jgi:hypothetical protein
MESTDFTARLKNLVGHEIEVTTLVNTEERDIPSGVLEEVGPDYVMIDTKKAEEAGNVGSAAQWFVRTASIIVALHPSDCARCAIDAVVAPAAKR